MHQIFGNSCVVSPTSIEWLTRLGCAKMSSLDTFKLYYLSGNVMGNEMIKVPYSAKNVIPEDERKRKFKNPKYDPQKNQTLCDAFVVICEIVFFSSVY